MNFSAKTEIDQYLSNMVVVFYIDCRSKFYCTLYLPLLCFITFQIFYLVLRSNDRSYIYVLSNNGLSIADNCNKKKNEKKDHVFTVTRTIIALSFAA